MIQIHIITGPFPPQISGGAKSFMKLIYPLNQDPNYNIKVTTIDPFMFTEQDKSLQRFVDEFKVNYIKWNCQSFYRVINRHFKWYSDPFALFAKRAKKIICNDEIADIYFLRGSFFSTFLLAPFIRFKLNKPVILFYSDPLLNNPYRNWTPKLKARTLHLETEALKSASGVIFTNTEIQKHTQMLYPNIRFKSIVIPHSYLNMLNHTTGIHKKKSINSITFTHSGHFYGKRQPFALFQAIAELKKEQKSQINNFQLQLIGQDKNLYKNKYYAYQEFIKKRNISEKVQFLGRMNYLDTITVLNKSDVLVNIDAPSNHSLFLPSKLIDYLSCKLPIWTLSPPGPAASVISEYGGIVTEPDNVNMIKNNLLECLRKTIEKKWSLNYKFADEFETYKIYPRLKEFLNIIFKENYKCQIH